MACPQKLKEERDYRYFAKCWKKTFPSGDEANAEREALADLFEGPMTNPNDR